MKKVNRILGIVTFFYLIILFFAIAILSNQHLSKDQLYLVEINRLMQSMPDDIKEKGLEYEKNIYVFPEKVAKQYKLIEQVSFLSYKAAANQSLLKRFYQEKNKTQIKIQPVLSGQTTLGYLRFDYKVREEKSSILWIVVSCITICYIIILIIFVWVKQNIVKPFFTFTEIPYELSKGNLKLHVKESKNRFFGRFLWGVEMLRDTMEDQKRKEYRLEKEKKLLLLSISHDIKTPLHAINLYAKALEEDVYKSTEERKMVAQKMQKKVKEIDSYVKEIMRSSTEELMDIEVKNEEFYLYDLLSKLREAYVEKCKLKKVALFFELVDNQLLKGDLDRLYEAFGNIMENAMKYGDGNKIKIFFSTEETFLLIHIFNSGEPMEEKDLPYIFESFYRGSNVKENQGNGLGLYICSEIMKKMLGDIYVVNLKDGMEFVLVVQVA